MKVFQLLFSLFLAFMLIAAPLVSAQAPTVPAAGPTPPSLPGNGNSGNNDGTFPGPGTVPTNAPAPGTSTAYPNYAG